MGTRHLICIVQNNKYRLAQYGQWDGYLMGQGADIAEFLRTADLDDFNRKVKRIRPISAKDLQQKLVSAGVDDSGWMSMEQSARLHERCPNLRRAVGAKVLSYIMGGGREVAQLNVEFARESLFCEWAYIINLDIGVLEIYKGFNKNPVSIGRFTKLMGSDGYAPVKLFKVLTFDEIRAAASGAALMTSIKGQVEE